MALGRASRALRNILPGNRLNRDHGQRSTRVFAGTSSTCNLENPMPRLLAPLLLALTPLLASAEEVIRVYNWND